MSDLKTTLRKIGGAPPAPFDITTATRTARVRAIRRRVGGAILVVALLAISIPLVRTFGGRDSGVVGRVHRDEQGPAHESKKHKRQGTAQSSPGGAGSVGSRTQSQQAPAGPVIVASSSSAMAALGLRGRLAFTWDTDTGGQSSGSCTDSPCAPVSSASDLKVMDVRTGRIGAVTTSPVIEHESRFSPDGSRLAYSVVGDGLQSLDTIRLDGSDHRRLVTVAGKMARKPTWSPDGKRIAFMLETASSNGGLGQGVQGNANEIWVVNADGTNQHRLDAIQPADHPTAPAWAPDGKRIAYTSERYSQYKTIRVTDLVSGRTDTLTGGSQPAWSPDGKSLAATDGSDVKIVDLSSGAERTLTRSPDSLHRSEEPAWSPDGRWVAFVRYGKGSGPQGQEGTKRSIWIVRSVGTNQQKVIDGADDYWSPTWGPAK